MADSTISVSTARGEVKIATDLIADPVFGQVHLLRVVGLGEGGAASVVDVSDDATRILGHVVVDNYAQFPGGGGGGGLTNTELRATPVDVDTGLLQSVTAAELAALTLSVAQSGVWTVGVNNFPASFSVSNFPASQAVTGPLTDAQLRAVAVPVSGTFWQATQPVSLASVPSHPVTGPLTDTELRATAVPVSGTFWQGTQPVSAASLPLPTGAATAAKQAALGTAGTPSADVISVQGITSMTPLKVDGSGVTQPVSGTFWQATQPVSGPLTDAQLRAVAVPVSGTFWQTTQPISAASLPLPTGAATSAKQDTEISSLASIDGKLTKGSSSTVTSVGDSATSVTLLASNTSRKSAMVYNDSSAALYLKLGATASTSSFTVKLAQDDYFEVPGGYTGVIDGIWASDAGGNARVTEVT